MFSQRKVRELKKMFNRPKNTEYFNWIRDAWTEAGGLITQATAMRLLERSKGRINQMITEGKLKEYRYGNQSFLSYPEIMKLAKPIYVKNIMKAATQEAQSKKVPDETASKILEALAQSIKEGEHISEKDFSEATQKK